MSDTDTLYDTSDKEAIRVEKISVGGKAPRAPIERDIPANRTTNRVLPVSDEAFKIVLHLA
jgi:hypothetical protein